MPVDVGAVIIGHEQFGLFTFMVCEQPLNVLVRRILVPAGISLMVLPIIVPVVLVTLPVEVNVTDQVNKLIAHAGEPMFKVGKLFIVRLIAVRVLLTQFVVVFRDCA